MATRATESATLTRLALKHLCICRLYFSALPFGHSLSTHVYFEMESCCAGRLGLSVRLPSKIYTPRSIFYEDIRILTVKRSIVR